MNKFGSKKLFYGYKFVGVAILLFLSLNFIFYWVCSYPNMKSLLSLSVDQPWGIITSVFVHENITHLMNNIESFFVWILLFILLTSSLDLDNRKNISKVLIITIFIGAFVVNAVEVVIWELQGNQTVISRGASGLVYSVLGVTFVSALVNFQRNCVVLIQKMSKLKKRLFSISTWMQLIRGALTLSFVIVIPLKLFTSPSEFFGLAPGIDALGHALGFLFGIVGGLMGVYLTSKALFK